MTKTLGANTLLALQNARTNGLVIRDFVHITAKNRTTGEDEQIGLWTGRVPVSAAIIDPANGDTVSLAYQGIGGLLSIPPITSSTELEVRTFRLRFSRLSGAMMNAIRLYDPKMAPIMIHRGFFDPTSNRLVDPATCLFDGYISKAPIRIPKATEDANEGGIDLECVSRSRILTRTSGALMSHQTLKKSRDDMFGKYLDAVGGWRIFWGEEDQDRKKGKGKKRERFFS